MIAVLVSRFDEAAREAVATWRPGVDVIGLTVDDLLAEGWVAQTQDTRASRFVAAGVVRSTQDLTAVVNLIPCVYDFELLGIRRQDRRYVSAELFAFLVWWLRALPCPVLNRPTSACLNGPSWRPYQWTQACRRADIPASPIRSDSTMLWWPLGAPIENHEVRATTVVRGSTYGDVYSKECCTLSALAGTDFLEVFFYKQDGEWVFHRVNLLPGIQRAAVRDMLAAAVLQGAS